MPIDPSIAMSFRPFDIGEAMERGMRMRQMRHLQKVAERDDARGEEARAALSEYLLTHPQGGAAQGGQRRLSDLVQMGGGQPQQGGLGGVLRGQGDFVQPQQPRQSEAAMGFPSVEMGSPNPAQPNPDPRSDSGGTGSPPMQGSGATYYPPNTSQGPSARAPSQPATLGDVMAAPQQAGPSDRQRQAYERLVRADPEKFLTFEGKRLDIDKKRLEGFRDLNDTAMQLLGGVHDQQTYDMARQYGRQLYGRYGEDFDALELPDQYSPELVRSLRLRGMETKEQLAAIARENRLDWDIADDIEDNERAGLREESLASDREARRAQNQERVAIARERARLAREGRGSGMGSAGPKSEAALYTDIRRRWMNDEPINSREKAFAEDYERRRNIKDRGRPRAAKTAKGAAAIRDGAIIRDKATGKRKIRRGGQWVDLN